MQYRTQSVKSDNREEQYEQLTTTAYSNNGLTTNSYCNCNTSLDSLNKWETALSK